MTGSSRALRAASKISSSLAPIGPGDLVLSPAGAIRDAALAGLGPALLPDWLISGDIEQGAIADLHRGLGCHRDALRYVRVTDLSQPQLSSRQNARDD